jgi:hypothetical protein
MVPPAFVEVGQLMLEGVLKQLEANAHHIAQPIVSQNESLETKQKK